MAARGYTVIQDWMLDLDLDVYETIILAVIFGFCQDGESSFTGSQSYLADKAKCSRRKVANALPKLVEKGYIVKDDVIVRGVHLCEYKVCTEFIGCAYHSQGGCECRSHNNTIYKNIDNKRENKGAAKFFKPSLQEVTDYCRERNNGIDPEEFFAFYESKGWMVGRNPMKDWRSAVITWEKSRKKDTARASRPQQRRESVFEHNLKVMDQMFGTDLHGQAYGRRTPDEQ